MTVVAGGLITLEYALEGLNLLTDGYTAGSPLSARDADVAAYITAATPIIEGLCGPVLPTVVTRKFHGGKSAILLTEQVTAAQVSSVTVDGVSLVGYVVDEVAGIVYADSSGSGFAEGFRNVAITMTVGFSPVPSSLQLAARELVRHWWQQGKQGNRPTFGDAAPGAPTDTPQGFAVPKRVMELCAPYRTLGGFA